jgi:hypothetical protein
MNPILQCLWRPPPAANPPHHHPLVQLPFWEAVPLHLFPQRLNFFEAAKFHLPLAVLNHPRLAGTVVDFRHPRRELHWSSKFIQKYNSIHLIGEWGNRTTDERNGEYAKTQK